MSPRAPYRNAAAARNRLLHFLDRVRATLSVYAACVVRPSPPHARPEYRRGLRAVAGLRDAAAGGRRRSSGGPPSRQTRPARVDGGRGGRLRRQRACRHSRRRLRRVRRRVRGQRRFTQAAATTASAAAADDDVSARPPYGYFRRIII